MRKSILTQSALSALVLAAAPFAHAQAKLHAIGDLPGGATVSQVRDVTRVNGALVAIGGSSANTGSTGMDTPVVWTEAGGLVAIPNLAVNTAGTPAFASAITPDGAYIASRTRPQPTGGVRVAARVTRNGLTTENLGTLPGFPGFSAANAISDDGSIVYGFGIHDASNHNQAIRFTYNGSAWVATAIPFLDASDDVSVIAGRAASADGSIAVGTSVNTSIAGTSGTAPGNKAFRYVHGTGVSAIPMLPGGTWNGAIGLTHDGAAALVVGDSSSAPQSEAYLYNFAAGQAVRLGTPNGNRIPNNIGGVSDDGVVVLSWYSGNSAAFSGVHNQNGWHDLEDLAERAGIDLAGWTLDSITGISADGTLVWGSGLHNGNDEGWVIEFPAGYLAAAADPLLADSPNSPIVGAWTLGDTSAPGGALIVFFEDGHYLHIEVPAEDETTGAPGFERGVFRWDQATGAIQFKTLLDTNGDVGLSGAYGQTGATATVTATTLTFTPPGEAPFQLTRVGGAGQSPIHGAFGLVNSGSSGNVVIFLPNGVYFQASYAQDMLVGSGDPVPPNGIERGTYTWDATTGALATAVVLDTNGTAGMSGATGPMTVTFPGSGRTLYIDGTPSLARATGRAVLYGIGDLPGSGTYSEVRDVTKFEGRIIAVGGGTANAGSMSSDTQVIWTPSIGLMAIPNLVTNTTGTTPLFASAITPNAAWVAGRSRPSTTGGARHAVRINTDTLASEDLGTIAGFPGFSTATSISTDGSILYGFGTHDGANHNQAVRYSFNGTSWVVTPLPFLAAGDDVSVPAGRGASADGSVVVGTSVNTSIAGTSGTAPGNKAFRYVHGTGVSAIPMLPGGTWNGAIGLSRNGVFAVVVGDSTTAPQSEAYLQNFSNSQTIRLGTPNGSRIPNNLGAVSDNGAVLALSWYSEDAPPFAGIHNQYGWHDLTDLAARAGVNLTGWSLNNITGMSPDATLVWGMGNHNGSNEGWVLEFPGGYLMNAAEPVPAPVSTPLVGAWTLGDTAVNGGTVLVFFPDGAYMHMEVPGEDELPHGVPGFERGTYTWDQVTGAITFKTLLDTNGDVGLSGSSGQSGFTATVSGDTLTVTTPPEGENPNGEVHVLSRVVPTRPIEGLFGNGSTPNDSIAAVFLPNGVYFIAEDGNSDPNTGGDMNGQDGLERGTYTWNATTGVFTATPTVDTNGEWGLSHPDNDVTVITFPGDQNTLVFDGENAASRVVPLSQPFPPEQPQGPDVPTRPAFFSAAGYLANNPDVAGVIGDVPDKLDRAWSHYYLYGISEGRTDGDFSVQAYLAQYPNLAAIYGTNLQGAAMHWYNIGRAAGLRIPAGFDVAGYFARNADIAGLFTNDKYGAWLHYYNYGVFEGRSFDANFIPAEYLELNLDLKAVFGGNLQAAVLHWFNYGHPIEDRMGRVPIGFNVDSYLARYPDLAGVFGGITPTAVRNVTVWHHYVAYGTLEARSDGDFEANNYLATNPDLAAVFGTDVRGAALHWYFYGRREGRRIPGGFNVQNYRSLYPDVVLVFGDDLYGSWLHYRDNGVNEGRIYDNLFRPADYLALNPDVAAVIGNNYRDALLHWLYYGQYEGRQAKSN